MDYIASEDMKFNNETPWSMNTSEIMILLAENGIREDVTPRKSLKCWIPTLMGPKQTPLPRITYSGIRKSGFLNSNECKLPISNTIHFQNYITADGRASTRSNKKSRHDVENSAGVPEENPF